MSAFSKHPSEWGEHQFTFCLCKRPVVFEHGDDLCSLSSLALQLHYGVSYLFLLSLLEHLTIDFPSHFILSLIDVF